MTFFSIKVGVMPNKSPIKRFDWIRLTFDTVGPVQ